MGLFWLRCLELEYFLFLVIVGGGSFCACLLVILHLVSDVRCLFFGRVVFGVRWRVWMQEGGRCVNVWGVILLCRRLVRMKCLNCLATFAGCWDHEYVCAVGCRRYMYGCMRGILTRSNTSCQS